MLIAISAVALLVGVLIGTAGIGGILLIPALELLTPLSIKQSMATALFTFIFTGIVGTLSFQRRGSIDWRVASPVCVGAALFGFVGAWTNSRLDPTLLTLLLAGVIVLAGLYTLFTGTPRAHPWFHERPRLQRALLFGFGAATGFGSGLTGVGGPALSVPMLVLSGFPALAAIGASQVIQILASVSGSVSHLAHGMVDLKLAALLAFFEVLGVLLGVRLAHAVDALALRRGVGLLCIAVGAGLLVQVGRNAPT